MVPGKLLGHLEVLSIGTGPNLHPKKFSAVSIPLLHGLAGLYTNHLDLLNFCDTVYSVPAATPITCVDCT